MENNQQTATRVDDPNQNAVLFILSNAHFYGDTKLNTGNSFSEIVHAYNVFKKAGYIVDFVSPEGGAIPLSYINTSDKLIKKHVYDRDFMSALKTQNSLKKYRPQSIRRCNILEVEELCLACQKTKKFKNIVMDVYEQ